MLNARTVTSVLTLAFVLAPGPSACVAADGPKGKPLAANISCRAYPDGEKQGALERRRMLQERLVEAMRN
jgi:hypothetical protein